VIRVLRYPRMSAVLCALIIVCAALRDWCVSLALAGCARVLLFCTLILLPVCMIMISCRFAVDAHGVSVGILLHMRRTSWNDVAALGILCCNSRRRYLYGMYSGKTDFLNLLHHAPACGAWGFVVPLSGKILAAIETYCPFRIDLSPLPVRRRKGRMRIQRRHALLCFFLLFPAAACAAASGAALLRLAVRALSGFSAFFLTLTALLLFSASAAMVSRIFSAVMVCPAFSADGVSAGFSLFLSWNDVRFGYVHRIARMSGLYLLSRPYSDMQQRGAPPVVCLSMPDTPTLLLAYLNYCPHAEKTLKQ